MSEMLSKGFAEKYRPTYLFFRDDGFYHLKLKDDEDAIDKIVVWEQSV